MSNFIEDLDDRYQRERQRNKIKKGNKTFAWNIPLKVKIYGSVNNNYMIRKGALTRFLYIRNNCRVHFTDADILTMLLQIQEKHTMDLLIENLKSAYRNRVEDYNIYIGKTKYELNGIPKIEDNQIFTTPQDVDIPFDDLLVLINLILSKDQASNPLWPGRPDFLKHTLSKYISLIRYYYYADSKARDYLLSMGYNIDMDIYHNYDTTAKRDEKRRFFSDFEVFEKSGVL